MLITYDRYLSIKCPLTHRAKQTKHRIKLYIVCIWTLAFIQWAPWIISYQYMVGRQLSENSCEMLFMKENPYMIYVEASFSFYGPLVFVFVIYFKITRLIKQSQSTVWKNDNSCELDPRVSSNLPVFSKSVTSYCADKERKTKESQSSENISKNRCRKENTVGRKYFKMTTTILLVFVVTWSPYSIQMVMYPYCPRCFSSVVFSISYVLTYMNSTANPFIYAFASMRFRKEFKSIFFSAVKSILNSRKNELK